MAATTKEQWYEHALDGFNPELSRFDDAEELFAGYFDAALANANYTYRKDAGASTNDAQAYVVRAGAVELCRVTLDAVGDAGFGMNLWEAGKIETVFSLNSLRRSIFVCIFRERFQHKILHQTCRYQTADHCAKETDERLLIVALTNHKHYDQQTHTERSTEVGQRNVLEFLEIACKFFVVCK